MTSNGSLSRRTLQLLGWRITDGDRVYCPTHAEGEHLGEATSYPSGPNVA